MDKHSDIIRKRYNRVSSIYDMMDRMIKEKWREDLLSSLSGKILEVGVGTGANFPFYSKEAEVIGIDFSEGMLKKAEKRLEKNSYKASIQVVKMDAQDMVFDDHEFDYVVTSCVFCSVPDPVKGMKEMKRVCKQDGQILMLEHMKSNNPLLGPIMDVLNPLTVSLWGANINRKTLDNLHKAGIKVTETEDLFGGIMKKIKATPK
ncbi:methyltransferase domain-containing protein [Bacillaceae bacterium S4-13-58]